MVCMAHSDRSAPVCGTLESMPKSLFSRVPLSLLRPPSISKMALALILLLATAISTGCPTRSSPVDAHVWNVSP